MKISIHFDKIETPYDGTINGVNIKLEADMETVADLLMPETQRGFIDNQLHIISYHAEHPTHIKSAFKAVVGGIAGGILETIEEHMSPFARVRRKITKLLNAINPFKAKKPCNCHTQETVLDRVDPDKWDRNMEDFDEHRRSKLAGALSRED